MRLFCLLAAVVPCAALSLQRREPIDYLSPVTDAAIHAPAARVHAFSHFDLTFTLHRRRQYVKLALEPSEVLAPDAQVDLVDQDGRSQRVQPLDRRDHRVFKGTSWVKTEPGHWQHVGWARIYLLTDGSTPLFEGAFSILGDDHHVMLASAYRATKQPHDRDVRDGPDDYVVAFRDSDIGFRGSLLERDDGDYGDGGGEVDNGVCNAHLLDFNSRLAFPLPHSRRSSWGSHRSFSSLDSLFGLFLRDNTNGGASNGGSSNGDNNYTDSIGSHAGCPTTRKVALVGAALDCNYVAASNNSREAARRSAINVVNTASHVYESSFNISLGLRNLTVFPANCPGTPSKSAPWNIACNTSSQTMNLGGRLNLFSAWRGQNSDSNAYWTLMTACSSENEVGLSWLNQLCINQIENTGANSQNTPNASIETVSGANVIVHSATQWQIFAHESGHTFGAIHDCTSQTCSKGWELENKCCPDSKSTCSANGQYIMNPAVNPKAKSFSQCTIGNICSNIGSNTVNAACLVDNRNLSTITGSQCGNGIVEDGEDCDCGGEHGCGDDKCCDPKTCKFTSGSVCDDANDDCCHQCKYASSDQVCRPSSGKCDPAEKCTGKSATCPPNKHSPDGQKCGHHLYCASGQCTSRDEQCIVHMGSSLGGNSTVACDDSSCTLACTSPGSKQNTCSVLSESFVDGTSCGNGGRCKSVSVSFLFSNSTSPNTFTGQMHRTRL